MSLLQTHKLTRHFSGITANKDVDFDLQQGEIRALIGPNGAGKTTFTSMLIGRLAPSSGTISFEGRDITDLAAHERVRLGMAYTFQITSVFANLSVTENVALAARRQMQARDAGLKTLVPDLLRRVGLNGRDTDLAADLSYGHQRLLEIAMGLAQSPKLLILDEPTQGLAESEIDAFKTLIRSLTPETTILLIEHNMRLVMELADTITVLNAGETLAYGTPAEIQNNTSVQSAYLGTD